MQPTADQVRAAINYDPETGAFTWRDRPELTNRWRARYPGTKAGTVVRGYTIIRIEKKHFRAARLAWVYMYGEWPNGLVDHINMNRSDDRIANLRLATKAQNSANSPARSTNTSGFKGVTWNKRRSKWQAQICVDYKHVHLGLYDAKEQAAAAYAAAANYHQGEFRRLA